MSNMFNFLFSQLDGHLIIILLLGAVSFMISFTIHIIKNFKEWEFKRRREGQSGVIGIDSPSHFHPYDLPTPTVHMPPPGVYPVIEPKPTYTPVIEQTYLGARCRHGVLFSVNTSCNLCNIEREWPPNPDSSEHIHHNMIKPKPKRMIRYEKTRN